MRQKCRRVPPAPLAPDIPALLAARDAALLSMDEQQIRAYYQEYNGATMPIDPDVFWLSVHKARTALRSLPLEARQLSKRWLLERGSKPLDNGEIPL